MGGDDGDGGGSGGAGGGEGTAGGGGGVGGGGGGRGGSGGGDGVEGHAMKGPKPQNRHLGCLPPAPQPSPPCGSEGVEHRVS